MRPRRSLFLRRKKTRRGSSMHWTVLRRWQGQRVGVLRGCHVLRMGEIWEREIVDCIQVIRLHFVVLFSLDTWLVYSIYQPVFCCRSDRSYDVRAFSSSFSSAASAQKGK